jgi:peroxiredoxin
MDKAIDFELLDHKGDPWRLTEQFQRGPVVLVFYRGDW